MPTRLGPCGAAALCLIVFCHSAIAAPETKSHPIIPGFERFYEDASSDAFKGGLLLLSELNCCSCHDANLSELKETTKQAPNLSAVASRVRPEFIRDFLAAPQQVKPGTTMPHVLHGVPETDRKQAIEALTHFLASTGTLTESAPVSAAVKRGEQLFHRVGCVACHDPRKDAATELNTSAPLPNLSSKYSVPGLAKFLENPLEVRPSGRMPHLNLSDEEARHIASFLLQDLDIPPSMTFKYFEGVWEKMPDFARLPVKATGGATGFDVNVGRPDFFAVRFEGVFQVKTDGEYRFFLGSDDGSRFFVNDQLVVDNDGIHAVEYKEGRIHLKAGKHPFAVEYFEQAGGQELYLEFQGRGVKRQPFEFAIVPPEGAKPKPHFEPNPELVERGKQLFQSSGCASCHAMEVSGTKLVSTRTAKKLSELDGLKGCLAESPTGEVPHFSLSKRQRDLLSTTIATLRNKGNELLASADQITHRLITFNCFACHERNGMGGVEEKRNAFFQSNQAEMGDEGRIPPHLTGIGDKLRESWMQKVFDAGAKDRNYMYTRMPRFGAKNLRDLAQTFAAADKPDPNLVDAAKSLDRKVKGVGRELVGEKGLSCIKCHTWGNSKASGIQAISLTTMTERLRPDWFHRYLLNPQQYRPGTRMPAAWPGGQSPFAKYYDGDAHRQIDAVWAYLEDGDSANPPVGLTSNPIELIPETEPIIYRNFLEKAGPRAIGVGYPEHVNLAYDAENCRLVLIWQGAFIDASLHWIGRGAGFQKPLGDNLLTLPSGPSVAVLESALTAWPESTPLNRINRFGGYRLDEKRRPVFMFRANELQIEDHFTPLVNNNVLTLGRKLRVTSGSTANAYLRAATGKQIREIEPGTFQIDQDWKIRFKGDGPKAIVRNMDGVQELLVPLASGGQVMPEVEMEYVW